VLNTVRWDLRLASLLTHLLELKNFFTAGLITGPEDFSLPVPDSYAGVGDTGCSQNVPFLKQNVPVGQNVPSQNVPMLMNYCNGFV